MPRPTLQPSASHRLGRQQIDIVYRVGGDGYEGVLFALRGDAENLAQTRKALANSKTWGEFRANLPFGEWEQNLAERFDDVPPDDEPFSADEVPGYADGDYPRWLMQAQLDWFPEELLAKYGERQSSVFNGEMLELYADKAEEIAAELRAMGHTVEKTDLDIT